MDFKALGEQVCRGLVVGGADHGEEFARRAGGGFLGGDEVANHVVGFRYALDLFDGGQLDELFVSAGGRMAEGADSLCDHVQGIPLFGVLQHEHLMQAVELRAFDVPMEVVGHQVEGVAVGQQTGQAFDDVGALSRAEADVDFFDFLASHGVFLVEKWARPNGVPDTIITAKPRADQGLPTPDGHAEGFQV